MFAKINKALRTNILVGLVLVTPIGITIFTANWFFQLITGFFIPKQVLENTANELLLRVVALIVVLMLLFLVGFFVRSFFGKKIYSFGEKILVRIPIFNKIYIQVRHISEAIIAKRDNMFKEVVLVEYPRKGLYSIAFITSEVPSLLHEKMSQPGRTNESVALFIPTTPNPTSGLMILASRTDITPLSITVPDAMKFVVSGGAVHPGGPLDNRPTLLDKLETIISRDAKAELVNNSEEKEDASD